MIIEGLSNKNFLIFLLLVSNTVLLLKLIVERRKQQGSSDAALIEVRVEVDGKLTGEMQMLNTQKLSLTITGIKNHVGGPAKIDGKPVFAVLTPDLADMVVSEDQMSAVLTPKGPEGILEWRIDADADLGEGVKTISKTGSMEIVSAEAELIEVDEQISDI